MILARFALEDEIEFADLFAPEDTRSDVIVTFLALLELMRLKVVRARQDERFGAITLALAVESLEEAAERSRDVYQFDPWRGGGEDDGHPNGNG
jgi:segregation and condensation protein A